jgi:low affinity Fe/Cu permease
MGKKTGRQGLFTRLAMGASRATGSPASFIAAASIVVLWAASGPLFGFGDTWQLVINTGTTIITFLMVFLIQNSQNRDTEAMQIKLDELIYAIEHANNALLDLEQLDEASLNTIRKVYLDKAKQARAGLGCTDHPEHEADGG